MTQSDPADHHVAKPKPPNEKETYEVAVFAPGALEPKAFSWDKHLTVAQAAALAAAAFGIVADNASLAEGREVLDRDRQLVAVGVRDGDQLELVDTGGGV